MWIKRIFEKTFKLSLGMPVKIVRGVRQAGKSALLNRLAQEEDVLRPFLPFDDLSLRQLANEDPALFLTLHAGPLIIDEAQYAPQLFPEIKKRIDAARLARTDGQPLPWPAQGWIWLTGSNQILMSDRVRESLAGRAAFFTLHPLAAEEILASFPQTTLADLLWRGGWPELYINADLNPTLFLNDYIHAAIEKDVVNSAGITKITEFLRVLRLAAARVGSLLVMSDLSKETGIQVSTVQDWLSALERMLFIHRLPPFSSNLNNRLVKTPKIYFNDTALAIRLQGWGDIQPLLNSPQIGGLFENLIWTEILRARDHRAADWEIFHWRTKDGHEMNYSIQS